MILILIIMLLILYYYRNRHSFISKPQAKKIFNKSKSLFANDSKYTDFKKSIPELDPVMYKDMSELYKKGKFNFENVHNVL